MRLICTMEADSSDKNPYEFSYYLTSQGIENECEAMPPSESEPPQFRIWVVDEDLVDKAQELYRAYLENPKDPRYREHYEAAIQAHQEKLLRESEEKPSNDEKAPLPKKRRLLSPAPYGSLSIVVILLAIALFIWSQAQRPHIMAPNIPGIIQAPLLSPLEKNLLYDYPHYFELRDELLKLYTPQEIEQKQAPSKEAAQLIQKIKKTPTWSGIYDLFMRHYFNATIPFSYEGPLFEKISQGEVWRLITPVMLHLDLLHIFFNLLWFILLGNQIEFRLGFFRYLLFMLIVGIASNTTQYLMSGPFFMGLSGIIVGMAGFIWARQQVAPWEGYLLNRFTLIFLGIFVIGMFGLQILLFILQLLGKLTLPGIMIANTAHLTGGIVGYLLGRLRFFSIRPR